ILFLALLFVPNPRLRTRSQLREYFPSPSRPGTVALALSVVAIAVVMVTTLDTTSLISYGPIFPLGIVALSLVPLVGYAGQISLAQLTFGGIGAIAAAHHGGGGSPLGLVLAMVFAAAIGAVVALPVMRLSGIYLALATAAFAVAMDRWIFNLPDFDLGPVHISLFNLSGATIEPLSVFGYRFDTPGRQLLLSAGAFAVMIVLVAALRWSRFGRQLVAMRDSEAACATFGLDLRWPRVGVFTLSAAIAGLGGALYGMQLGSVNQARFDLLAGLPIFILVVVAGAGLVGGALFTGISLYGLIPVTSALGPVFAKINTVTPGLTGIGLGRSPSGAIPMMSASVASLRRNRIALVAMVTAMTGAYVLRLLDVIDNWPFAGLVAASFLVASLGAGRQGRRAAVPATDGERRREAVDSRIEWAGVTRPWSSADLSAMNALLAFDGAKRNAPTFAPAAGSASTARVQSPTSNEESSHGHP
ncbi:MAG: branched-chain amino acid ABC transporter permease, partial [Aquihabitans sp.]